MTRRAVAVWLGLMTMSGFAARAGWASFAPITQLSVGPHGEQPDGDSFAPAVDADGSVVAFVSSADNLVADDGNGANDVFIVDRRAGTTTRVIGPGGEFPFDSDLPAVSDDGKLVAFVGDGILRVFNRDFGTVQDVVELLDEPYAFSGNGRFLVIAGEDEQQLVPGDHNGLADIFLFDRLSQQFERISRAVAQGEPDGACISPAVTPDGRYVGFVSNADNLVAGGDGSDAVFVYDRINGATERVSGFGTDEADLFDTGVPPALSTDGRYVAYLGVDAGGAAAIYVRDRTAKTTQRLGLGGAASATDLSTNSALTMSGDGERFVFGLFGDVYESVYLLDQASASTVLVSAALDGTPADGDAIGGQLSRDGQAVVFSTDAINLVPSGPDGITLNVFVAATTPACAGRADVNCDGVVNAADISALIELIFYPGS